MFKANKQTTSNSNDKTSTAMDGVEKMVYGDKSSYLECKSQLEKYLSGQYGPMGRFVEKNEYVVIPPIGEDLDDLPYQPTPTQRISILEKRYMEREKKVNQWESDKVAIFGKIQTILSKDGEDVVRAHQNWEEANGAHDPLKLWKIISASHSLGANIGNNLQAQQKAKSDYNKLFQADSQTLVNFRDNFQLAVENMVLLQVASAPNNQEQALDFMDRVNKKKYGDLINTLKNNYLRNAEVPPTTLVESYNIFRQYVPTYKASSSSNDKPTAFNASPAVEGGVKKSFNNKNSNSRHGVSNNDKMQKLDWVKTQQKTKPCNKCGKLGHWAKECKSVASVSMALEDHTIGETMFSFNNNCKNKNRDLFVWDTGASVSLVNDLNLLSDVEKLDQPEVLIGINGNLNCIFSGTLGPLGKALYNENAPYNLISASTVEKLHKVEYKQMEYFKVKVDDNSNLKFNINNNSLYVSDLKGWFDRSKKVLTSIAEKKSLYTARELKKAELVKNLLTKLGYASVADLVNLIRSGGLINGPVTVEDVIRYEDIYGTNPCFIKGRLTDRGPVAAVEPVKVEVGRTDQHLHCDIMYLDESIFLVTVAKPLNLLLVSSLGKSKGTTGVVAAVRTQMDLLKQKGFIVRKMSVDADPVFVSLKKLMNDLEIEICGAGSHEPIVERAIRVIKDRVRSVLASLSYHLPSKLISYCVNFCVNRINAVVRSGGGSFSAKEAFTGYKLDYNVDCKCSFGEYVQLYRHNKHPNSVRDGRSVGAIALMPVENNRGTWKFFVLTSENVVSSDNWVSLNVPNEVIEKLTSMYKDGSKGKNTNEIDAETVPVQKESTHVIPSVPVINDSINPDTSNDVNFNPVVDTSNNISDNVVNDGVDSTSPDSVDTSEIGVSDSNVININDENIIGDKDDIYDSDQVINNILHLSLKKGVVIYKEVAHYAMEEELRQMVVKKVFEPKYRKDCIQKIIRSSLFFKEKWNPDGSLNKLKARLVAGGDQQEFIHPSESSSPTINTEALFVLIGIAANKKLKCGIADVEGAFLEAPMNHVEVNMELDKKLAAIVVNLDETFRKYIDEEGKLIVQLKKALYGCVQSSNLWYKRFNNIITNMNFRRNGKDHCVFWKEINGCKALIGVHVDDIIIFHKDEAVIKNIINHIKNEVTAVKSEIGCNFIYLGMNIKRNINYDYSVSMEKYTNNLNGGWKSVKRYNSPADLDFFKEDNDPKLANNDEKVEFHSNVAKVLYLAKRTRPDVLLCVSHLASKVIQPTVKDICKLNRLISYLSNSSNLGIIFNSNSDNIMRLYCDAAYLVHNDCKSRSGVVALFNGGVVAARSNKQSIVTKSSTESELIALCDGVSWILYFNEFMTELGYNYGTPIVYEDNLAVINVVRNENNINKGLKHVKMKYYFIHQHVKNEDIILEWCKSAEMVADLFTKPLIGQLFEKFKNIIVKECV